MKHLKKLLALFLVAISIFAISLPAMAELRPGRGMVNTDPPVGVVGSLNVRQYTSINAPVIGTLTNKVTYLFWYNSPNDSWLGVYSEGTLGHVMAKFVRLYETSQHPITKEQAFGPDTEDIEVHDRGNRVRNVQVVLKDLGLSGGYVDGDFGINTLKGVKEYRKKYNLKIDGIVGPATKSKMWITHKKVLMEQGYK